MQFVFKDTIGEPVRTGFDSYNVLQGMVGCVSPQLSHTPFTSTDHTRLAMQARHQEDLRRTDERAHTVHSVTGDFTVRA